MAAYRADIEIGVIGVRNLEQLRSSINQTARAVDSLNDVVSARGSLVQSVQNYTNSLNRAAQSLLTVGAGTEAETKAVREYVQILGQATAARERQNQLIEEQIQLQQTAARTARLVSSGITERTNQYTRPIGPQPASTVSQFPIGPNPSTRRFKFENDVSAREAEAALRKKEYAQQQAANQQLFQQEKLQLAEIDRIREQNNAKELQRRQKLTQAIKGSLSSAVIGGAFPLLFGQSPEAAVGGAIGGLLGGAGGGFAGSLLGTALGEIAAKQNVIKELAADLGLASNKTEILAQAFQQAGKNTEQFKSAVVKIQGLGLALKDQISLIQISSRLTGEYGGSIEKVTSIYADFISKGKVGISDLTKLTAQGIPIQQALADKFGVSRTKVLELAKDGKISVQELSDTLIDMGNKADGQTNKAKSGFDRFKSSVQDVATQIVALARTLAEVLGPVLDGVLAKIASGLRGLNQLISNQVSRDLGKAGLAFTFGFESQGIDNLRAGLQKLNTVTPQSQEELNLLNNQLIDISHNLKRVRAEGGNTKLAETLQRQVMQQQSRLAGLKFKTTDTLISKLTVPSNLPPTGESAKTKAPSDAAARKAQELSALLNQLREQLRIERDRLKLNTQLDNALADGNLELAASYESEKRLLDIREKRAKIQKDFDAKKIKQTEMQLRMQLIDLEQTQDEIQYEKDLNKLWRERYGITEAFVRTARDLREALFPQEGGGVPGGMFRTDINLMPELTGGAVGARVQELKDELQALTLGSNQAINGAQALGSAFSTAFTNIVSGATSARDALANFFQNLSNYFLDMAGKIIEKWLQMTILNSVLQLFPSGTSVFGPSGAPNYSGVAYGSGGPGFNPAAFSGISFRATGGPVVSGSPYMVGERGPELFVPGRSGSIVPNSQLGGDNVNVVVNVDAKGTSVAGNDQTGNQLGRVISAAVQAELVKQKRPGGLLA